MHPFALVWIVASLVVAQAGIVADDLPADRADPLDAYLALHVGTFTSEAEGQDPPDAKATWPVAEIWLDQAPPERADRL